MDSKPSVMTHYRTCHFCEAMCGLKLEITEREIISIRGDEKDVHSKGHLCPKAFALKDLHEDPDRLRKPVKRSGNEWIEISWEQAFSEIEKQIRQIQKEHGRDAVGVYSGNPTVHNTVTLLHLYDFYKAFDTRNRFASHSLDQLPLMLLCGDLFGHLAMFPVPDIERTQYMLMLGANPMVSNGSLMSTPGISDQINSLKARGGKLVVVDPMRTKTAEKASEHLFIIPGSDIYFLLALIHVILEENLANPGRLLQFTHNLNEIEQLSKNWKPEWAESLTGISADTIRRIAKDFAKSPGAVAYGRLGVSVQQNGTLCQWAIIILNLITGNLDLEGGSLFALPAIDFLTLFASESKSRRWTSRVSGLPETGGDLPAVTLAEEILTKGPGQIRALFTIAGNPARSIPNSDKLEKALSELEFMVSIDLYRNETTRHAHIILPPLTGTEVIHYGLALYMVSPQQSAKFSEPAFPRPHDTKYDHEILRELQKRVGRFSVRNEIMQRIGPEKRLDMAIRTGPYGTWGGRMAKKNGLSLKKIKANPHGIKLGSMRAQLPQRLFTKNKKINALPESIINALTMLNNGLVANKNYPFLLIGRRHLRSNNSWMHNSKSLQGGSVKCTAIMHPEDGLKTGIKTGDLVTIESKNGQIQIQVELQDTIKRGVISIPHGWGHPSHPLIKLGLAHHNPGVNINAIISENEIDHVSGNAVFNGIPVKIIAQKELIQ